MAYSRLILIQSIIIYFNNTFADPMQYHSRITLTILRLHWPQLDQHLVLYIALFPGLPTIQLLIACSCKRSRTEQWEGLGTSLLCTVYCWQNFCEQWHHHYLYGRKLLTACSLISKALEKQYCQWGGNNKCIGRHLLVLLYWCVTRETACNTAESLYA